MGLRKWFGIYDTGLIDEPQIAPDKGITEESFMTEEPKRTTPLYDFSDPLIRQMVQRHEPRELIMMSGEVTGIHCDVDGMAWPCPAHLALKKWNTNKPRPKPHTEVEPARPKGRK